MTKLIWNSNCFLFFSLKQANSLQNMFQKIFLCFYKIWYSTNIVTLLQWLCMNLSDILKSIGFHVFVKKIKKNRPSKDNNFIISIFQNKINNEDFIAFYVWYLYLFVQKLTSLKNCLYLRVAMYFFISEKLTPADHYIMIFSSPSAFLAKR